MCLVLYIIYLPYTAYVPTCVGRQAELSVFMYRKQTEKNQHQANGRTNGDDMMQPIIKCDHKMQQLRWWTAKLRDIFCKCCCVARLFIRPDHLYIYVRILVCAWYLYV